MDDFQFTLNGLIRTVSGSSTDALISHLRNQCGVSSPRYGCGREQCGACVVLINNETAYSCTTSLADATGKHIDTVEGLADHPFQQALIELNAAQCGYCLSGIIMTVVKLLRDNPMPTREEIKRGLVGHLCRCGAHNRIIRAVELAAARQQTET
jgi:nicotinate dehydrogenase subunit A